ncbi:PEPxxWA-CTERM sorting domain-containing protein [Sphingomonas changnyeongensis]|uniref:PEPxxWA-CTERM sorting domain-containing protein n=1 Tax=Sphingomonas changnyeongensis TaxID=2698679 RepID=A0A7Z2NV19_9SPHN|nr:PEPxxWA-CTERM sorting domain-containing protein [Sphingomonas changnyeongensis]QHL90247.1 PEPxxWA-CTERM sorting domain-containing protein [Sphingomonas changnyeongensis]
MKSVALAFVLAATLAAPASAANLLVNGSFENGFNGWTLGGTSGDGVQPAVINYNSATAYPTGAYGEAVPATNSAANPGFDAVGSKAAYFVADLARPQTLSQTVNVISGTNYTFGFDVYLPFNGAANPNDASFTASVGGIQFASFSASGQPAGKWLTFKSSGVATVTGPSTFQFTFNSFGIPAKDFVVDRVFFAPTDAVPEPASWAMMITGFGLAGMGLRRRAATAAFA